MARFRFAPLLSIRVRDWYANGDGGLEARLLGIAVARSGGPETARSEAMRYLAELPWFPHAVLANAELLWREIAAHSIEVATPVADARAAVVLEFDPAGDIVRISAPDRPRQEGEGMVERPWAGSFTDYREIGGLRLPAAPEVVWELPDGRYPYFAAGSTNLS